MKNFWSQRLETAILAFSFVLIWVYFLAHQAAQRQGAAVSWGWNALLGLSVVALIAVLLRRFKRVSSALKEVHPAQRGRGEQN